MADRSMNVVIATALMADVPYESQQRVLASMGVPLEHWQERWLRDLQRPETRGCVALIGRAHLARARGSHR